MATSKAQRTLSISVITLGMMGLVSVGVVGTLLAVPADIPPGLAAGDTPTAAPVSIQEFTDTRTVQVALSLSDPAPITINASGRVTGSPCAPGVEIASGSVALTIDGNHVVAFATDIPLWRDLAPGDTGSDVSSLQRELQRTGHDLAADGYYGWDTRIAIAEVLDAAGTKLAPGGVLPLATTTWIPAPSVTVKSCDVRIGNQINAGATMATLPATLQAVSVSNIPTDLLPGTRTLDFGEFTLATNDDGQVTDPTALATVTGSRLYPGLLAETAGDGITVDWSLTESITVVAVPPRALYNQEGKAACMQTPDGTAIPVTVVAASLGQSLIALPDETKTPEQVSLTPNETTACN